jgi:hypothetical protein
MLLYLSSYYSICVVILIYVSSYYHICVLMCVSSYYYEAAGGAQEAAAVGDAGVDSAGGEGVAAREATAAAGAQFTCFTGTTLQIQTLLPRL